jgi:hypothetical protein
MKQEIKMGSYPHPPKDKHNITSETRKLKNFFKEMIGLGSAPHPQK